MAPASARSDPRFMADGRPPTKQLVTDALGDQRGVEFGLLDLWMFKEILFF